LDTQTQDASSVPHPHPSYDVGWELGYCHGWPSDKITTMCNLCEHKSACGVYWLKQHIVKLKRGHEALQTLHTQNGGKGIAALKEAKGKKLEKAKYEEDRRQEVQV